MGAFYAGSRIQAVTLNETTMNLATSGSLGSLQAIAGTFAFCTDTLQVVIYTGNVWIPFGGGIVADPISTGSAGTMTSGTTETEDSVLGTYACPLVGGRRYEVRMNGLMGGSTVAGDLYALKIRDGGLNPPTSSSTLIAYSQWEAQSTGGGGEVTIPLAGTFVSGYTGTHKIAFFAQRTAGTGVFTPLSGSSLARELYVLDLGSS